VSFCLEPQPITLSLLWNCFCNAANRSNSGWVGRGGGGRPEGGGGCLAWTQGKYGPGAKWPARLAIQCHVCRWLAYGVISKFSAFARMTVCGAYSLRTCVLYCHRAIHLAPLTLRTAYVSVCCETYCLVSVSERISSLPTRFITIKNKNTIYRAHNIYLHILNKSGGTRYRRWLRLYATSRKVTGSESRWGDWIFFLN
jgi:hypothetical protein